MLDGHERQIGRFAWVMAWVGLVVGQLHALARFATADGKEDLELPAHRGLGRAGRGRARAAARLGRPRHRLRHLRQDLAPGVPGVHAVRLRRLPPPPALRASRSGCGALALAGYVAACVGVFFDYWTQWTGEYNGDGIESSLFSVASRSPSRPDADVAGSTVLGITLLAKRFRPVLPRCC